MLKVVVDGVATVVPGKLAIEQSFEIAKSGIDTIERIVRPLLAIQVTDRTSNGICRTDLHGVRDIEIAAPILHELCPSPRVRAQRIKHAAKSLESSRWLTFVYVGIVVTR